MMWKKILESSQKHKPVCYFILLVFIYFIKLDQLLHLLYFMWCHNLIKIKVYYCLFFWHFINVYLLNLLIESTTTTAAAALVWCNIYLKQVFGTCYSFLSFFSWLWETRIMFLIAFCITPGRQSSCVAIYF